MNENIQFAWLMWPSAWTGPATKPLIDGAFVVNGMWRAHCPLAPNGLTPTQPRQMAWLADSIISLGEYGITPTAEIPWA